MNASVSMIVKLSNALVSMHGNRMMNHDTMNEIVIRAGEIESLYLKLEKVKTEREKSDLFIGPQDFVNEVIDCAKEIEGKDGQP